MSVLKDKRNISKVEYTYIAYQIYVETISFLTRLSARYSRIVAEPIANLAGEIIDYTMKANSMMPTNEIAYNTRKEYLLKARASLMALDTRLTYVYEIMMKNPQGCFVTAKEKKSVSAEDAVKKLDSMANNLGDMINREQSLIEGVMKSDTTRINKELEKKKK